MQRTHFNLEEWVTDDIFEDEECGRGAEIRTLTTGFGDLHATINITPLGI